MNMTKEHQRECKEAKREGRISQIHNFANLLKFTICGPSANVTLANLRIADPIFFK
jgi:hypothetical protein